MIPLVFTSSCYYYAFHIQWYWKYYLLFYTFCYQTHLGLTRESHLNLCVGIWGLYFNYFTLYPSYVYFIQEWCYGFSVLWMKMVWRWQDTSWIMRLMLPSSVSQANFIWLGTISFIPATLCNTKTTGTRHGDSYQNCIPLHCTFFWIMTLHRTARNAFLKNTSQTRRNLRH